MSKSLPEPDLAPDVPWYAKPGLGDAPRAEIGLRFACTQCGNCCSGPSGYVQVSDAEVAALAARLQLSPDEFTEQYTHMLSNGRSLQERPGPRGDGVQRLDCVFLDRTAIPGKAVCGVYEDRPSQCRTWPFWNSVVSSPLAWQRAAQTCPGINKGPLHDVVTITVSRAVVDV